MLAKRFGIAGNVHTGYPDLVYSRTVKLGWLRSLVLDFGSWEAMLQQVPNDTCVAAVVTGQTQGLNNDFWSEGWKERYEACITELCERSYKKLRLIEFTNEWDFWDNEDRAQKAAELAMIGTNICKRYGILGVLGSVASADWKAQLASAFAVIDRVESELGYEVVHGFAFHPYVSYVEREGDGGFRVPADPGEDWERLSDKIRVAIDIAGGRPVAITEGGIKVEDAGGLDEQQLYVHGFFQDELSQFDPDELLMATYFCWCDQNGAPGEQGMQGFGLINENGRLRPAYNAATYQFQNAPVVNIPVQRLIANSYPEVEQPPVVPEPPIQPPVQIPTRTVTVQEAMSIRWRALVPTAVYNHDFGFERHWRAPENAWWGSPLTESELLLEDERPVRIFANAVIAYNGSDDTVEVLS
jgi:hypothetical protein